ncbi:MAG: hypothetical protein IPM42_07975 [Saprospiraceae bacterium]|nr:hypothetical protein [Saprospiraceae bacterium]
MKTYSILLSITLSITCAGTSFGQACTGFGDIIKNVWQQVYNISHPIGEGALTLIPVVGQSQAAVDGISSLSESMHAEVFTNNSQSWATIGSRELPVISTETRQHGTLVKAAVGGVRTFVTAGMLWDDVEITIEKTDGRAETEIIVCTFDMNTGAKNNVEEYTFPNGNALSSKTFNVPNTHGKSISVKLRNKSVANTFAYTIKSKGFLNINKQTNRASTLSASKVKKK